jgi:hypothetical protein
VVSLVSAVAEFVLTPRMKLPPLAAPPAETRMSIEQHEPRSVAPKARKPEVDILFLLFFGNTTTLGLLGEGR